MRGHIAARKSCSVHGDNGCEIQGEAGSLTRAQEKREWNAELCQDCGEADQHGQ